MKTIEPKTVTMLAVAAYALSESLADLLAERKELIAALERCNALFDVGIGNGPIVGQVPSLVKRLLALVPRAGYVPVNWAKD